MPPPVVSDPATSLHITQGRYLTATLHSLSLCVMGLYGSALSRDERDRLNASFAGHLKTMWEANCSCRRAGYPEGSITEAWGDVSNCSGIPSPVDVPTMSQAAARESAAEMLRSLRQLAGLMQPNLSVGGDAENSNPTSYAGWEVLQAELLSSVPSEVPPSACSWGEALWCFNPACSNLAGPSELALKTFACGGGCGVRYCSPECQAQGWRDGHRLSCGLLGR